MAERLLGAKAIAFKCDLTTNAVWKWRTSGKGRIPSKHLPAILELARERNVDMPAAALIEGVA